MLPRDVHGAGLLEQNLPEKQLNLERGLLDLDTSLEKKHNLEHGPLEHGALEHATSPEKKHNLEHDPLEHNSPEKKHNLEHGPLQHKKHNL